MIGRSSPLAAALALTLWLTPAAAQDGSEPIPGIDIIVQKKPGGTAGHLIATTGRDGRFAGRVRLEPGFDYEVTAACRARTACPSHRLVALTVNGRTVRPVNDPPQRTRGERNGIGIYLIGAVVLGLREPTTVVIAGQVAEAPVAGPSDRRGPAVSPGTTPDRSAATRN